MADSLGSYHLITKNSRLTKVAFGGPEVGPCIIQCGDVHSNICLFFSR